MPATELSWAEAKKYCAAVGGRLPTEAEWEYAVRGGKPGAYYGLVPEIAWYAGNSGGAPHPVGTRKPNAYGLYDVLGNVREWVLDRYYNRYDVATPATGGSVGQPLTSNASTVAGEDSGRATQPRFACLIDQPWQLIARIRRSDGAVQAIIVECIAYLISLARQAVPN